MIIEEYVSLRNYNTFGIDVKAKFFCEIHSLVELRELLPELKKQPYIFIGGGSNVLFTKDFEGLVIVNKIIGKKIDFKGDDIIVSGLSGENWHEFVLWTLENKAFGLENLSLIPGSLGAAPMQNIGAYGSEIKQTCVSISALDLESGEIKIFMNEECEFGYRESVFKRSLKNKYFILEVSFALQNRDNWKPNANYGDIQKVLDDKKIVIARAIDISDAVIEIRRSKLPDPKILGNSGSFFKNPVISFVQFERFIECNPSAPYYIVSEDEYKIPAGWLIEMAGLKGKRYGNCGVHEKQALVLVNYGNASGKEIFELSTVIVETIFERFGILLEREVNVY